MTKKRRRKPKQIVKLLQEREAMLSAGKSAAEVSQKREISEATRLRWQKQFGGMKSEEAGRLRDLEIENQKLKEMLAEAELGGNPCCVRVALCCSHFSRCDSLASAAQHPDLLPHTVPS